MRDICVGSSVRGRALRLRHEAARFQLAQEFRRAVRRGQEIRGCHFAGTGERFDDRAETNCARLELCKRFAPAELGQRPHDGFFPQRRADAQRRGHGCCDDLADRMTVVVRGPEQQLQEGRVEGRLLVDRRKCGSQLAGRHVRAIAAFDDDADDTPAPERHPHTLTRRDVRLLCRRPVVEYPPQRRVDGDREDHATPRSMHRNCGQACAWVGVNGAKCAMDGEIPVLVIISFGQPIAPSGVAAVECVLLREVRACLLLLACPRLPGPCLTLRWDDGAQASVEEPILEQARALDRFLASIEKRAFRMARIALRHDEDALDSVQDAMLQLARRYGRRPSEEWRPLFYRILQNRIRDCQRRRRVQARIMAWLPGLKSQDDTAADEYAAVPDRAPLPAEQLAADQAMQLLERSLADLPGRQQEAFMLRAFEGMDVAQTAAAMGCSEGSVKTHYSRAVHTLREQLGVAW